MDVLVLEWACASGRGSRAILPEGFGMLRTLCTIMKVDGNSVTAVVSRNMATEARYLGADRLIFLDEDHAQISDEIFDQHEAVFVIAPESHGMLSNISRSAASRSRLLSCSPETTEAFSNKVRSFELVSRAASYLKVPKFIEVEADPIQIEKSAREVGLPAVVKPVDGTGSEGISIVRTPADSKMACARLASCGRGRGIVQEFVQGRHLSATFFADAPDILPLSLNTQSVAVSQTLRYQGGSCPFPLASSDLIWRDLARIVGLTNSKGLMGMDFVAEGEDCYFMEINPRMTTSCIGLAKVIEPSLGQILLDGSRPKPRCQGYAQWAILPLQRTVQASDALLPRIFEIPEVVSPPFPFGPFYMKDASSAMLCVRGTDPLEMPAKMQEARRRLAEMNIIC